MRGGAKIRNCLLHDLFTCTCAVTANATIIGPKSLENPQNSHVETLGPVWQGGMVMTESEKQFPISSGGRTCG